MQPLVVGLGVDRQCQHVSRFAVISRYYHRRHSRFVFQDRELDLLHERKQRHVSVALKQQLLGRRSERRRTYQVAGVHSDDVLQRFQKRVLFGFFIDVATIHDEVFCEIEIDQTNILRKKSVRNDFLTYLIVRCF